MKLPVSSTGVLLLAVMLLLATTLVLQPASCVKLWSDCFNECVIAGGLNERGPCQAKCDSDSQLHIQ